MNKALKGNKRMILQTGIGKRLLFLALLALLTLSIVGVANAGDDQAVFDAGQDVIGAVVLAEIENDFDGVGGMAAVTMDTHKTVKLDSSGPAIAVAAAGDGYTWSGGLINPGGFKDILGYTWAD